MGLTGIGLPSARRGSDAVNVLFVAVLPAGLLNIAPEKTMVRNKRNAQLPAVIASKIFRLFIHAPGVLPQTSLAPLYASRRDMSMRRRRFIHEGHEGHEGYETADKAAPWSGKRGRPSDRKGRTR